VPVAVEDGDGYLRRFAAEGPCNGLYVLRDGCVYVDGALRSQADEQLAHVHVGGRPEHAPPWGRRYRRDGPLLPLYEQLQALDGLDREVGFGPSGPQRVARAEYPRMALRRPDPPLLVQALLAQYRHPAGDRYLTQLLAERLRGERVRPLRVSGRFEMRHLERDPLGHGGVLHGGRS
jgi:hypothetical protein